MEVLPKNQVLEFHADTLEAVRKLYDLDKPGSMKDSVKMLDKWIQTQYHFMKKDFSALKKDAKSQPVLTTFFEINRNCCPDYLERIMIASKGSVERAKERLDQLFTLRTLMPQFFQDRDPSCDFENIRGVITFALLPKMTKDNDRVFMVTTVGKKFTSKLFLEGYKFCSLLCEYLRAYDYPQAYHIVIDYLNAGIPELLAAADLMELRQAIVALIEGYGLRIKGVHILVNSKLVDVIVSIAKQVVSEKIGKRIHIHKTYKEMFEYVPKEVLPKEYGGDEEKSFIEIHDNWREALCSKEFKEFLKIMDTARTDETLRQTDKFNEQYMGMPGTFRSLSVD